MLPLVTWSGCVAVSREVIKKVDSLLNLGHETLLLSLSILPFGFATVSDRIAIAAAADVVHDITVNVGRREYVDSLLLSHAVRFWQSVVRVTELQHPVP